MKTLFHMKKKKDSHQKLFGVENKMFFGDQTEPVGSYGEMESENSVDLIKVQYEFKPRSSQSNYTPSFPKTFDSELCASLPSPHIALASKPISLKLSNNGSDISVVWIDFGLTPIVAVTSASTRPAQKTSSLESVNEDWYNCISVTQVEKLATSTFYKEEENIFRLLIEGDQQSL